MKLWPEGSQLRKHLQFQEPDGWAHSNWAWRSNGYIDHPGGLLLKVNKAECHRCLGVLKCDACGNIIRSSTKTADMNSQLAQDCLEWAGKLLDVVCEALTYHFVTEEDELQITEGGIGESMSEYHAKRKKGRLAVLITILRVNSGH